MFLTKKTVNIQINQTIFLVKLFSTWYYYTAKKNPYFYSNFLHSWHQLGPLRNIVLSQSNGWSCKLSVAGSKVIHPESYNNFPSTLRSQIEGYTRLLIFRKFSTLPAVIWASPFINFQENFQPPCFFTYTNEKNSTLPVVIRAYPLSFQKKTQPNIRNFLTNAIVLFFELI